MQRWNGWGNETITMDLPPQGLEILRGIIGKGRISPDYPLEKFLERMPTSRLPAERAKLPDRKNGRASANASATHIAIRSSIRRTRCSCIRRCDWITAFVKNRFVENFATMRLR